MPGKEEALGTEHPNYKRHLCVYFLNSHCARGNNCHFAHGEHELRSRPAKTNGNVKPARSKYVEDQMQARMEKQKDAEVMSWLQAMREQEGEAGQQFNLRWKEWCKTHGLSNVSKAARIQCIHTFRAEWEGGAEESAPLPDPGAAVMTKNGIEDVKQIPISNDYIKPAEKDPKDSTLHCLEGHEMTEQDCAEAEEFGCDSCGVDITCGARLFDCRVCDWTLCHACGTRKLDDGLAVEAPSAAPVEAAERLPEPGPVANCSCLEGHELTELVCEDVEYFCDGCNRDLSFGDVLYSCDPCDYCLCPSCFGEPNRKGDTEAAESSSSEAAWSQGLSSLQSKLSEQVGCLKALEPLAADSPSQQLLSECEQRCSRISGPLLFAGSTSLQSMANACLSEQNLTGVATTLQLSSMFQTKMESMSKADLSKAVLEGLLQLSSGLGSDGATQQIQAVCDALLDFVCLVGVAHFVALGVTQAHAREDAGELSSSACSDPKIPKKKNKTKKSKISKTNEEASDDLPPAQPSALGEPPARSKGKGKGKAEPPDPKKEDQTAKTSGAESNEEAMLRLMRERGIHLQAKSSAGEDCRAKGKGKAQAAQGPDSKKGSLRYFKEKLCLDFDNGFCSKRDTCSFAHGLEELQAAKELHQNQTRGKPQFPSLPRRYKRDLCKFHAEGHCWRGEDCTFAHGLEEMYRSDVQPQMAETDGPELHQGPSWELGPTKAQKVPFYAGPVPATTSANRWLQ